MSAIICRGDSTFDYPLSARFEEMDAIVVFEDVVVPWNEYFITKMLKWPINL